MTLTHDIAEGAHNLLINCAELKAGETLLIICEDPALGWYDDAAPRAVADAAIEMGVTPTIISVGCPENEVDPSIATAIGDHDCTLYFARVGDQDRFGELPAGKRSVMCYIRNLEMLASPAGRIPFQALKVLKDAVDEVLITAEHIEITCPLGTKLSGNASEENRKKKVDVCVRRFPLGVPMPLDAAQFSGQVALARFLTPTGSKCYFPPSIPLERTSFAAVANGRITGFHGDADQTAKIEQHYDMVATQFGIDRDMVHSWHAGIHPGISYRAGAADDPDRWSNTVFMNPRVLHFHTCGNYAPAEISWMIFDHTVSVDGEALWKDGRLMPNAFPKIHACLENWPELADIIAHPAQEIGI